MTGAEKRVIKASILTGFTDFVLGGIAVLTGFADWYYSTFHFFGIVGFGMITYGLWNWYFYGKETGVWKIW